MTMKGGLKLHIEQNVSPIHFIIVLEILDDYHDLNIDRLIEIALRHYKETGRNPAARSYRNWFLKNLEIMDSFNLINRDNSVVNITSRGKYFHYTYQYNEPLFYDLCHYLYYSEWDPTIPEKQGYSWTYRTLCNYLWDRKPNDVQRKDLINKLISIAQVTFENDSFSLSQYAISGATNWLYCLEPEFIIKKRTSIITNEGRDYCTMELFLLSVQYLYESLSLEPGTPVLFDDDKKAVLGRLCLMNIDGVERMYEMSKKVFPEIITENVSTWGKSIIIHNSIQINTFSNGGID